MPKSVTKSTSLWEGPYTGTGPNGGITQSALARFLSCRERFRLSYVEGWCKESSFNHYLSFGSGWHECEEALAKGEDWRVKLAAYYSKQLKQHPLDAYEVDHWYQITKVQFPEYVAYWSKHKDTTQRVNVEAEKVFDVPYRLPSGREVRLRGRRDGVDFLGSRKYGGPYLFETKTKSQIDEQKIGRQLTGDLQTNFYLASLQQEMPSGYKPSDLKGVRYNVIRRDCPIRRGKGTAGSKCPKCKGEVGNVACPKCRGVGRVGGKEPEGKQEFYERLRRDYIAANPEDWFKRWKVEVIPEDIERFKVRTLNPILEQVCDWFDWIKWCNENNHDPFEYRKGALGEGWQRPAVHWTHPHGCENLIDKGGVTDLDQLVLEESTLGLTKATSLFKELQ